MKDLYVTVEIRVIKVLHNASLLNLSVLHGLFLLFHFNVFFSRHILHREERDCKQIFFGPSAGLTLINFKNDIVK